MVRIRLGEPGYLIIHEIPPHTGIVDKFIDWYNCQDQNWPFLIKEADQKLIYFIRQYANSKKSFNHNSPKPWKKRNLYR